jgi:integrase
MPPPRSASTSPSSPARASPRRPNGTGSLFIRRERSGRDVYYGKWRIGNEQVKRRIGPKRNPSTREGLTRTQAEAELRRLMASLQQPAALGGRITVKEGGELLIESVRAKGRKKATIEGYESHIRVHLVPFFDQQRLDRIDRREVEDFVRYMGRSGRSTKTTFNALAVLHSIFELARREGRVLANPCSLVDKPRAPEADPDIHFLELEEVEALIRAVPDDDLGRVERPMYLAAAMTGMRQGELLALRWRDIDWTARRVRVRRNFVRGEFGTPKSKRSSRSVPLADRLAGELDLLHQTTLWRGDEGLVFAHPHTGKPIDRSKLLKRFKAALRRAEVREVRFHEYADVFVMPTRLRSPCSVRFPAGKCRHNQSASRKARSVSGGW